MPVFSERHVLLASWILSFAGLLLVLPLKLLPALLAGLLVYELVNMLTPKLQKYIAGERARWLAVALLGTILVSALTLFFAFVGRFIYHESQNPAAVLDKFLELLQHAREQLPPVVDSYLPASVDDIRIRIGTWLGGHLGELQLFGKGAAHTFITVLVGMILGAIIALQKIPAPSSRRPLASALFERLKLLVSAFRSIVFAQIKIALLNTVFTAICLYVLMPLFGVHLPLTKTLILLTFLLGLLPVVGNLMSNTLIFLVAMLSMSIWVAGASLLYLIFIHTLEHFLNARIVGGQIKASMWELLLAMLVFEAAFGLPGVVAGPLYYAYLKSELRLAQLI